MNDSIVYDLLIILCSGLVAAVICRTARVSVLVGYLVVGMLIGDGVLGLISEDRHDVEKIAEAGVFMLLFAIGLEFSLKELWHLGRMLVIGGGVQMICVAAPVAATLKVAGTETAAAILIGLAVSFSSTVLVFKTLSERGHSGLPHGRRAIGILLFQDAALIPLLLLIPLLTGDGEVVSAMHYAKLAATSVVFLLGIVVLRFVLVRWVIPAFANLRSAELIVMFTLVALAGITLISYSIGLPPAIGAFAAGLVFSGNRWSHQIDALLLPFRETFAAVFFVSLGLMFDPQVLQNEPWLMLGCLAALVGIKTAAAMLAIRLTGLPVRTSIAMGFGLAHVGEFAFVLLSLGWQSGVINEFDYQRIVALAILSLVMTPPILSAMLRRIGDSDDATVSFDTKRTGASQVKAAVVMGGGPIGRQLATTLENYSYDVCVVDLSPLNLQPFAQEGFRTVVGDATDIDTLERADTTDADLVIICVPDDATAARLVKLVRDLGPTIHLVVRCRYQSNVSRLHAAGADAVISEEAEVGQSILRLVLPS